MIFEADYTVVKKALTTIQNSLTGTELKKPEITAIELHVDEEEVYFSYQGKEDLQLTYQLNLIGADPILEGIIQISLRELMDVIKGFDKNAGTLLFERDGMELRIDDGVYEPEIITLPEDCDVEEGFCLSSPDTFITVSTSWFAQRMELARINNKTTFLPATSDVAFILDHNQMVLRSFNLTNLYESSLKIDHQLSSNLFLMDKNASSRLSRLLKSIKDQELHLYWDDSELFVFTEELVFHFVGELNGEFKSLYEALPIESMSEMTDTATFKTSELKKITKVEKGVEAPLGLAIKWSDSTLTFEPTQEDQDEFILTQYPFKSIQKIASKWMSNMEIARGKEENCHPLVIKHESKNSQDTFIVMPMEPTPDVVY